MSLKNNSQFPLLTLRSCLRRLRTVLDSTGPDWRSEPASEFNEWLNFNFKHKQYMNQIQDPNVINLLADYNEKEKLVSYISSTFFTAHNVWMLRQMHDSIQRQVHSRVGRHAVQNHRHRAAVGHLQPDTGR